jgi:hypothetical protein
MARAGDYLDFRLPWTAEEDTEDGGWVLRDKDGHSHAYTFDKADADLIARLTVGATLPPPALAVGTDYEPQLSEGLAASRMAAETKEAILARRRAAELGAGLGAHLAADADQTAYDEYPDEPYLRSVYIRAAAQQVENAGRRADGLDFGKADKDLEGKK